MKTLSNLITVLMCLALVVCNVSCTEDELEDEIVAEVLKADFKFMGGDIICPPHSNYQIGWEATAKNVGDISGKIVVQAWLSQDEILGDDAPAGGLVFGNAEADESLTKTFGATVENVSDYNFLILQIDHESLVDETDETNNLRVIAIPEEYSGSVCNPEVSQADLEFVSGEIICPPHSNYQIGWKAEVKNSGSIAAEATVQAWLSHDAVLGDDTAAGGLVFGNADANESISKTFGATVSNVEDYKYLLLQIDHSELVDESDETNNVMVIEIPEGYPDSECTPEVAQADLEFLSGEITCPPHSNYQIGWKADVKNSGDAAAEATVQAWLSHDQILGDDAAAGGKVFGTIDPNGNIADSFGATVSDVGDYNYLLLQVDHSELVDESDETNNVIVIEIPVGYPNSVCDPGVSQADLEFLSGEITCPPHSNYQIGWKADVRNSGSIAAEATVQAWLSHDQNLGDDAPAGGLVFGTIDANGNIAKSFGATVSDVGDYAYLLLQIDHGEHVDESDETNNVIAIKIPENYPHAMCPPEDFDAIGCGDINFNESELSGDVILASDPSGNIFEAGDVIIYRTNQNRCGKLQILDIEDAENKRLTIKAVTFNADGSIYAQTNSLIIRGTWSCDLDEMVEPARGVTSGRDFFWQRVNETTTHLTPRNGATFYKYEF